MAAFEVHPLQVRCGKRSGGWQEGKQPTPAQGPECLLMGSPWSAVLRDTW